MDSIAEQEGPTVYWKDKCFSMEVYGGKRGGMEAMGCPKVGGNDLYQFAASNNASELVNKEAIWSL